MTVPITELVAQTPWREAVTYRETWPHEYVLTEQDNQRELLAVVCERFRSGEGVASRFFRMENTYLFIGEYKLRPFEQWIKPLLNSGDMVYSYVAIRADEQYREGYASKQDNLIVQLPLKEAGIDKAGVLEILDGTGIGLPEYYEWRTRSGCTFCFFQQKIE